MASANSDYTVISGYDETELIVNVKAAIASGWTVQGGAYCRATEIHQPMVKAA